MPTVEESLRRVMRDILPTRHKEDICAFFLAICSGQEHKFPMVEWDIVTFEMVGEVETGIWTYLLHPANSTLATVLALIQSAGPPAKGYSTVQQPGPASTPPVTHHGASPAVRLAHQEEPLPSQCCGNGARV